MQFASVRIITDDVPRLTAFYEALTGLAAERPAPVFSVFPTPAGTLAIGDVSTTPFGDATPRPGAGSATIVEFLVDDVDDAFARAVSLGAETVLEPTTMPWGNRSAIVRDPDGTLVNLFRRPSA
jgi:catechol 2,3-dioxygenase-like lactoylglutathione lyase family enzyme